MTSHVAEAKLTVEDKSLTLPGVAATDGADALGISALLKDTGTVTYDAGFVNTAACKSAITYIDGDAGILRYRGYPIDQLAAKSPFVEVSYLLIYGELPSQSQLAEFEDRIRRHTMLHEDLKAFFRVLPTFERESTVTLNRLNRFARDTDPLVTQLRPAARELSPTLQQLALLAARAMAPKPEPEGVGLAHIHAATVSVREQAGIVLDRVRRGGTVTFRALCGDSPDTLTTVARFLALLELFREGAVAFDQVQALGELSVRWTGDEESAEEIDIDEFDGTPLPAPEET